MAFQTYFTKWKYIVMPNIIAYPSASKTKNPIFSRSLVVSLTFRPWRTFAVPRLKSHHRLPLQAEQ